MLNMEFMQTLTGLFSNIEELLHRFRIVAKPKEVTSIQYNIMEYLYFNKSKCLSDISNCIYLSMPNASREIKKLNELGYIQKKPIEGDKRTLIINLSERGNQVMDEAFKRIYELANQLFIDLSEVDQKELTEHINNVGKKLFSKNIE